MLLGVAIRSALGVFALLLGVLEIAAMALTLVLDAVGWLAVAILGLPCLLVAAVVVCVWTATVHVTRFFRAYPESLGIVGAVFDVLEGWGGEHGEAEVPWGIITATTVCVALSKWWPVLAEERQSCTKRLQRS